MLGSSRFSAPTHSLGAVLLAAALTACGDATLAGDRGALRVNVTSSFEPGVEPIPTSYTVTVTDIGVSTNSESRSVDVDGSVTFANLGQRIPLLVDLEAPDGCRSFPPEIELELADDFEERSFTVNCSPTGIYRVLWVELADPVEIRFRGNGDLFVANSGFSLGNAPSGPIRRVDPGGGVFIFGESVADPDALVLDPTGGVASQPGAVLVGGSFDFANDSSSIWEISPDGSTTETLITGTGPLLTNPGSFAFLPDGDLLVANFNNNSISRLTRTAGDELSLAPFHQDPGASEGMISLEVLAGRVYAVTGSPSLVELELDGTFSRALEVPAAWGDPAKIAVDTHGEFGSRLILATTEGILATVDPAGPTIARLGTFAFDDPVFGIAVSPVDGAIHVAESTGRIWRVRRAPE